MKIDDAINVFQNLSPGNRTIVQYYLGTITTIPCIIKEIKIPTGKKDWEYTPKAYLKVKITGKKPKYFKKQKYALLRHGAIRGIWKKGENGMYSEIYSVYRADNEQLTIELEIIEKKKEYINEKKRIIEKKIDDLEKQMNKFVKGKKGK